MAVALDNTFSTVSGVPVGSAAEPAVTVAEARRLGDRPHGYTRGNAGGGRRLNERYVLRELLGRGGMADVFRAIAIQDDRQVATKVLRSPEPGSVRWFRSEASVLSRLDHPGVDRLRETGAHEGVLYLVLDLA